MRFIALLFLAMLPNCFGGRIEVIEYQHQAMVGSAVRFVWKVSPNTKLRERPSLKFYDANSNVIAKGNATHFATTEFAASNYAQFSAQMNPRSGVYEVEMRDVTYLNEQTYRLSVKFHVLVTSRRLLLTGFPRVDFPLKVNGGPKILEHSFDRATWTMDEGSSHVAWMEVQGKPRPELIWTFGGEQFPSYVTNTSRQNVYRYRFNLPRITSKMCRDVLQWRLTGIQSNISREVQIRIRFKRPQLSIKKEHYCILVHWKKQNYSACSVKYQLDFFNSSGAIIESTTMPSSAVRLYKCYDSVFNVNDINDVKIHVVEKGNDVDDDDVIEETNTKIVVTQDLKTGVVKVKREEEPFNMISILVMAGCGLFVVVILVVFVSCYVNNRRNRRENNGQCKVISLPLQEQGKQERRSCGPRYVPSTVLLSKSETDLAEQQQGEAHYMVPKMLYQNTQQEAEDEFPDEVTYATIPEHGYLREFTVNDTTYMNMT